MLQSVLSMVPGLGWTSTPESTKPTTDTSFCSVKSADGLFPCTSAAVDGPESEQDCESCSIKYPRIWWVNESADIYGEVSEWSTHIIIATGKTDWVGDADIEIPISVNIWRTCS